jgi:hypothetical protein
MPGSNWEAEMRTSKQAKIKQAWFGVTEPGFQSNFVV